MWIEEPSKLLSVGVVALITGGMIIAVGLNTLQWLLG